MQGTEYHNWCLLILIYSTQLRPIIAQMEGMKSTYACKIYYIINMQFCFQNYFSQSWQFAWLSYDISEQ